MQEDENRTHGTLKNILRCSENQTILILREKLVFAVKKKKKYIPTPVVPTHTGKVTECQE